MGMGGEMLVRLAGKVYETDADVYISDTLYEIPDSTDSLSSVASSPAVTAAAYSHSASGSAGRTPRE